MKLERIAPPAPPKPTYTLTLTHEELIALRLVAGFAGTVQTFLEEKYKDFPIESHNSIHLNKIRSTLCILWGLTNEVKRDWEQS
jgi:hypothetical protein